MAQRRVALVTGANRGIGREVARQLAGRGLVTIFGARELLDVTDQASVERLLASMEAEFGRLDVLVNNAAAGFDKDRRAGEVELASVEATLATNLLGPWRLCLAALPLMRRGGYGRIVNLSSGLGSFAVTVQGRYPSAPAYSVSKVALNMLTLKLAYELRGTNILVNAVDPGRVRTDMGGPNADLSMEEGAATPVWLATLPDGGPSGGFFRDQQTIPW